MYLSDRNCTTKISSISLKKYVYNPYHFVVECYEEFFQRIGKIRVGIDGKKSAENLICQYVIKVPVNKAVKIKFICDWEREDQLEEGRVLTKFL